MEDKLNKFIELTEKKVAISKICEELEVDKMEALGMLRLAQNKGYNVIKEIQDDEIFFFNQGEVNNSKCGPLELHTDKNNEFKFIAISNTLLGSTSQQMTIIKDVMEKAKKDGITNVFICGNISAGTYSMNSPYHEDNFIPDTEGQIDYIIKNFPKIEGMTTYFITGKKERDKVSVGNRIADDRDDMVYLGSEIADFTIDNCKVKMISSPLAQTYTESYRLQQYLESFRSEDKPDILLLGGLNQLVHVAKRGINGLSLPSMAATTKEMEDKRRSNTVGAVAVKIKTDKNGKLDKNGGFIYTSLPYYVTDKNDYKRVEKSIISTDNSAISIDDEIGKARADKYFRRIKNGGSVEDFKATFHLNDAELFGLIDLCNMYGNNVGITLNDKKELVFNKSLPKAVKLNKPDLDDKDIVTNEFLFISDTHLCNVHQQLHLVYQLYAEAQERGITKVLHFGDLTDGFYPNRKPYPSQQFLYDFNDQGYYVLDNYPHFDDIETLMILGNHDVRHFANGGASLDKWIGLARKDIKILGQDTADLVIDNVKIKMDHPGDGSSKGLSYALQKRIDKMESGDKPNIYGCGHYHKPLFMSYRNIYAFLLPALCAETSFEHVKALDNYVGGYFVTVYSDRKTGNVEYLNVDERLFGKNDIWEEAGKDAKKLDKVIKKYRFEN